MKCVDCMYFTRQNGDNGYCSEFVQPVNVRCGCSIDAVKDAFKEPRPDLVEVVRCKDCKNHEWCSIEEAALYDKTFFCKKGERREDEQQS